MPSWYRTSRGKHVYWRGTIKRMSWLGFAMLWLALRLDGVKRLGE